MHFPGPNNADLANVYALNTAFIAWQRLRPPGVTSAGDLPGRVAALSREQRERLAQTPFLLPSLAEDDEPRWQSLFAEHRTRDLLQCVQPRDDAAAMLIAGVMGFLWQLSQRNPYAARLLTGASLAWCEQLASCTLMDLFARTLEDRTLLSPRMVDNTELWNKLLTAGVSNRRHLRRAARVAALQTVLTESPLQAGRSMAAAACRMPAAQTRRSKKSRR